MRENYNILTTSNPNHPAKHIASMSVNLLNLHTATKLLSVGKENACLQNDGKTPHASKCIKYSIMTKVIDSILLN